jgi:hypothetical protein
LLKFEQEDGQVVFLNQERIILIRQHPDGGLAIRYQGDEKVMGFRCKRFQLVKQGAWYS